MAVEMIGGPRLCEPLLATGLGRFTGAASRHANGPRKRTSPHWRSGWVSGASQRATTNSLGTTSQPCASLPPWHSGFNQLSLDPKARRQHRTWSGPSRQSDGHSVTAFGVLLSGSTESRKPLSWPTSKLQLTGCWPGRHAASRSVRSAARRPNQPAIWFQLADAGHQISEDFLGFSGERAPAETLTETLTGQNRVPLRGGAPLGARRHGRHGL